MNKTKLNCSLNDTTSLKNIILENPDLPLLVFCGEYSNSGKYGYEQANVVKTEIEELTLYGDMWLNKEDYEDKLTNDLSDEEDYIDITDEDYDKMIKKKIKQTEFVRAIVLWVDN